MITIHGLTPRQLQLANLMWSCDTVAQHRTLVAALQGQDQRDAQGITEIILQEFLWENLHEDTESAGAAAAAVQRARRGPDQLRTVGST